MHLQREFSTSANRHNPYQADSYLLRTKFNHHAGMMDQTDLFWEKEIDRLRLLPRYTLSHAEIRIAPYRVANPLVRPRTLNS